MALPAYAAVKSGMIGFTATWQTITGIKIFGLMRLRYV